jgi:hypothetical protein
MEIVRSSETFVNQTTRYYIPEDYHLHTRRRENLKSHLNWLVHILLGAACTVPYAMFALYEKKT